MLMPVTHALNMHKFELFLAFRSLAFASGLVRSVSLYIRGECWTSTVTRIGLGSDPRSGYSAHAFGLISRTSRRGRRCPVGL